MRNAALLEFVLFAAKQADDAAIMAAETGTVTTAIAAFTNNPYRSLYTQQAKHFRSPKKNEKVDFDYAYEQFSTFVKAIQELPQAQQRCLNWQHKRFSNCNCFATVEKEPMALYMANFCLLSNASKQITLKAIVQSANVRRRSPRRQKDRFKGCFYFVPISGTKSASLCQQSFMNLFMIRKGAWKRLTDNLKDDAAAVTAPIPHGLTNNNNRTKNSHKDEAEPFVVEFLEEIKGKEGAPYASRFIRHITGIGIRNAEVNNVELPSSMGHRALYARFCHEQGKQVLVDDKGNYGSIKDMQDRTDDEWGNAESLPVCAYSTFCDIWKRRFPNLKVRPPSEDTCNDCHIIRNRFRYKQPTAQDEEEVSEQEELIMAAAQHVESARAQRALIDSRIADARTDRSLPLAQRQLIDTIVIDYAQNLDLPHFGAEQPGETYYFTPKTVFSFGVADVSLARARLYAYCYEEENGKKGGNNVASMIIHFLKLTNRLIRTAAGEPVRRKRLTIAADNCGGQNKNNHVIRMALYLVESGFYEEVEIIFYVKGHTKNTCDRSFNLMKKGYHKRDIYTYDCPREADNLCNVLGMSRDIEIVKVKDQDFFKDWYSFLNKLYTRLADGTIKDNHIFRVTAAAGSTKIRVMTDDTPGCEFNELQNLKKRGVSEQARQDILKNQLPNALEPPGLREIKQVELYRKWRKFVPEEFQDEICPKPPDEVLNRIRDEKTKKARAKRRRIFR